MDTMDHATLAVALEDPGLEAERTHQEPLHGCDVLIDEQRDDVLRFRHGT
jgi:hypothetical protein